MSEHTPGPWYIANIHNSNDVSLDEALPIRADDGSPGDEAGYYGMDWHVAAVWLDCNNQGEANANLIAAAPDLLESGEKLLTEIQNGEKPRVDDLLDAITKAKGQQ